MIGLDVPPGMYVEHSPEGGWSTWVKDEDGDWHELPSRGEVLDQFACTYYRVDPEPVYEPTSDASTSSDRASSTGTKGDS